MGKSIRTVAIFGEHEIPIVKGRHVPTPLVRPLILSFLKDLELLTKTHGLEVIPSEIRLFCNPQQEFVTVEADVKSITKAIIKKSNHQFSTSNDGCKCNLVHSLFRKYETHWRLWVKLDKLSV
jgi:hypothetical protein